MPTGVTSEPDLEYRDSGTCSENFISRRIHQSVGSDKRGEVGLSPCVEHQSCSQMLQGPYTGVMTKPRAFINLLAVAIVVGMLQVGIRSWPALLFTLIMLLLSRPKQRGWWLWLAVIPALLNAVIPRPSPPGPEVLRRDVELRCREIASQVERLKEDPKILGLLAGAGEAVDPNLPFLLLDRVVAGFPGRSAYLCDDRGRIVAWGGAQRGYPAGLRAIGPRLREVRWSATRSTLVFREPLAMEGRLIGGISIAEVAPREGSAIFGMRAPRSWRIHLADIPGQSTEIAPGGFAGVTLPVLLEKEEAPWVWLPGWLPWTILALLSFNALPFWGAAALLVALQSMPPHEKGNIGIFAMLLMGLLLSRGIKAVQRKYRAPAILGAIAGLGVLQIVVFGGQSWLPEHLFGFGPAIGWIISCGLVLGAWPDQERRLGRRISLVLLLVGVSLLFNLLLPVMMLPSKETEDVIPYPQTDELDLKSIVGLPGRDFDVRDLCNLVADTWGLTTESRGALLILRNGDGDAVSRWGDLQAAGDQIRQEKVWKLENMAGRLELWTPLEPWSLLKDWSPAQSLDQVQDAPVWSAVLTRSGMLAASLHPEIRGILPASAGEIYHRGGARSWMVVEGRKMPARISRVGPWLVAEIIHWPPITSWIARILISLLWVLAIMSLSRPHPVSFRRFGTFGGRLRLFIGLAVLIPLAVLTVVLQLRFAAQQRDVDRSFAVESFRAARYTAQNFAGGTVIDDELARWLAAGWGGEVSFFDGARLLATSRPDLIDQGRLPSLPDRETLTAFMLGREESVVSHRGNRLFVGGGLQVEGRRLLLELSRGRISTMEGVATPADWLLGGAGIAALFALALVRRVEKGLGRSLKDLVELSRRLLHGERILAFSPPRETDLAEVLAAVEGMARKVQERESRLREQEEMLRILLSTLEPAVFLLDAGNEILFENPPAETLLKNVQHHELERILKSGEIDGLVNPRPGHDESWRVASAEVPLPGGGQGRVVVIEDVTEMLRAQRLEQLTQMARIVAHEVKNPLTPIRLWVQELEEARHEGAEDLGELIDQACPSLLRQVERLRDSANAFSNLVALEHWNPEKVDLLSFLGEIIQEIEVVQRRGIRLLRDEASDGPVLVETDRQWMRRALDTLILNSLTAIGEEEGWIVFRTRLGPEEVVLELEDTGGGVPNEDLDNLFSPRFSSTRTGTGLGLALVQQVMSRSHGSVQAENAERGLRIRLLFPLIPPR